MMRWSRKQRVPDSIEEDTKHSSFAEPSSAEDVLSDTGHRAKRAKSSSSEYEPPLLSKTICSPYQKTNSCFFSGAQLDAMEVYETVDDVPRFGIRSRNVPNTGMSLDTYY